jgi:glycosyltransferase involved in cell wall biosynthesis
MPEFDLLVAGTGDDLDALRAEFGAYSNIQFLGHVPQSEISRVYARATAAILPSLVPETFGLAVVEALACSAPVIVKRSGGGPEIVHRSQAGYVYENSEQLQSIVRELASDRDRVELLRGRARRAFDQFFTLERHLNDYLSIVRDIGNAKLGQGTNGDPASRLRASSVP